MSHYTKGLTSEEGKLLKQGQSLMNKVKYKKPLSTTEKKVLMRSGYIKMTKIRTLINYSLDDPRH